MTYPGGPTDPQQPQYGQQPYQPPYGQPQPPQPDPNAPAPGPYTQSFPPAFPPQPPAVPWATQPPVPWAAPPAPPATQQRGGKVALIGIGGLLAVIVLLVGGYFTYQKVFVDTPTEVVQAYIDEARKDRPDRDKIAGMLCRSEADKFRKESDKDTDNDSSGRILDWRVTGETVTGDTAVVYTSYKIKSSSGSRTTDGQLTIDLVKEDRDWKICDFQT